MLHTKEGFSKTFVDDNYVIQELIFLIVLCVEVIKLLSFIVNTIEFWSRNLYKGCRYETPSFCEDRGIGGVKEGMRGRCVMAKFRLAWDWDKGGPSINQTPDHPDTIMPSYLIEFTPYITKHTSLAMNLIV